MQRFVVCGEALIDLVQDSQDSTFRSTWSALSAGGPMNTAIGLARLGEPAQFCGRLSTDRFGVQLREHLQASDVGLSYAALSDDPTSLAIVSLDEQSRASYAFHFTGTANFGWQRDELPLLADDEWLHIASLALVVSPSSEVLAAWAAKHPGPMSLDLNVRPSVIADPVAYWRAIAPWLEILGARGGVLKASDEDVEFLAQGSGDTGEPIEVLGRWADAAGCSLAVITLGPDGAMARDEHGQVFAAPGHQVEVVDTVGAGDTFMAGFLSAYGADQDVAAALTHGVAAAAIVCTHRGAQPPTRDEVAKVISASQSS